MSNSKLPSVAYLLHLDGRNFIEQAYLAVLGRPSDEDGRAYYLQALRSGVAPAQILLQLASSDEGRRAARKVPGLDKLKARFRAAKIPLIGRWVQHPIVEEATSPRARALRMMVEEVRSLTDKVDGLAQSLGRLEHLPRGAGSTDAPRAKLQDTLEKLRAQGHS